MDFKFSKDADDSQRAGTEKKGRQSAQLLVLLLLAAGFAYMYFFTGLIKPLPEQKTAEPPVAQMVKKPLPLREDAVATDGQPVATEAGKVAPVAQSPLETGQTDTTNAAQTPAVKPVPAAAPVPAPTATPAAKQPAPAPAGKQEQKPSPAVAEPEKTPAVVQKASSGPVKKTVVAAAAAKKTTAIAREKIVIPKQHKAPVAHKNRVAPITGKGAWTVLVGNYILEDVMAADMARVRKAGFDVSVKPGGRVKARMNRLFVADYGDRVAAQAEMYKLKQVTSDAFIMEQGGKYALYAGSYLLDGRVASEKARLDAAGFPVAIKHVQVSIPARSLAAGSFSDKKTAEAAVKKLAAAGLKARVVGK